MERKGEREMESEALAETKKKNCKRPSRESNLVLSANATDALLYHPATETGNITSKKKNHTSTHLTH